AVLVLPQGAVGADDRPPARSSGSGEARPASPPASPTTSSSSTGPRASTAAVLYDQYNNTASLDVTSQNFEAAYDAYDDEAADDFVVPAGQSWQISRVDVDGEYNTGPADSVNVRIYQDA